MQQRGGRPADGTDVKRLAEDIPRWIAAQVDGAGARGVVLGLSGGIDSAVVGALARRAVGDNVLGLVLPCHSTAGDEEDARLTADSLGIETVRVDLAPIFDSLLGILPEASHLVVANLKPRLRMVTLYYYASLNGHLVAGTGNRSEIAVGYFTKYGDGGADILPIGGLFKSEVVRLAEELGIPERIRDRPPSAGLWEDQTDEEEMGVTYDELDRVLAAIEAGKEAGCGEITLKKIREMMAASDHKRAPIPTYCP